MKPFKIPSYIIQRETYTSRIEPFMNKPIAKVFTGQRRVGKSFMLFQIMQLILNKEPKANIIYINKEDIAFDNIDTASALNKYIVDNSSEEETNYIFIDEIQEIDFVATKDIETIYVQVALHLDNDKTIEREFGNLLKIKDNYPKMVITLDEQFKNTYQGITHIPIRKFLLT